ncbi:MAG TPA: GNAT family N-acetyltransferase [Rubrobacteraceae bacterium]|nr:GNAT family N-acetyltransferase [Rubrobacteraceae bacterium]
MYLAHRHRAAPIQIGWALRRPTGASSGTHRALLDGLTDNARRLIKGLSEGWKGCFCFEGQIIEPQRALTGRTAWQRLLGGTGLELFCAASYQSSSSEGGAASSADASGEDEDTREEADDEEQLWALTLADGTYVLVREIKPKDVSALQRLWERLSDRTIRLRYLGPMKELSDEKARHLAEVDGENQYALVALDPDDQEEIVAMVRYDVEEDTNRAEYAALVEDRLQGLGIGVGLTRALIEAARERGVQSFDALVASENRGMIRLLRSLDLPERERRDNGSKRVEVDLFPNEAQEDSGSN